MARARKHARTVDACTVHVSVHASVLENESNPAFVGCVCVKMQDVKVSTVSTELELQCLPVAMIPLPVGAAVTLTTVGALAIG